MPVLSRELLHVQDIVLLPREALQIYLTESCGHQVQ